MDGIATEMRTIQQQPSCTSRPEGIEDRIKKPRHWSRHTHPDLAARHRETRRVLGSRKETLGEDRAASVLSMIIRPETELTKEGGRKVAAGARLHSLRMTSYDPHFFVLPPRETGCLRRPVTLTSFPFFSSLARDRWGPLQPATDGAAPFLSQSVTTPFPSPVRGRLLLHPFSLLRVESVGVALWNLPRFASSHEAARSSWKLRK